MRVLKCAPRRACADVHLQDADVLSRLVTAEDADVLCLQETKIQVSSEHSVSGRARVAVGVARAFA